MTRTWTRCCGTLMENTVFEAVYRTSQAAMMSIERPYATPWVAAMTGYGQRSIALMQLWKDRIRSRCWSARLAGSCEAPSVMEPRADTARLAAIVNGVDFQQ